MWVVSRDSSWWDDTKYSVNDARNSRERERNSWRRRYHHLTSGNEWEKTKNRNIKLKRNKSGSGYRFECGPSIYCIITRHPLRNTLCNVKHAKYIKDKKMFAFPPMLLLVSLFLASSGWISAIFKIICYWGEKNRKRSKEFKGVNSWCSGCCETLTMPGKEETRSPNPHPHTHTVHTEHPDDNKKPSRSVLTVMHDEMVGRTRLRRRLNLQDFFLNLFKFSFVIWK